MLILGIDIILIVRSKWQDYLKKWHIVLKYMVNDIKVLVFDRSPKALFPPIPDGFEKEAAKLFDEFQKFF